MIDYEYQLQKLLNKVNRVTSPLRHGRTPPMMALAELCDRQIEVEEAIASQPENTADEEKLCKICGQGPETDHNNCMIIAMHR